jgi:very-short-patch-repair endonuclease
MSSAHSTSRARELRRVSTLGERRLWECLRDRRLQGLKFRRQQPLHGYILDFYCAEYRLVVELDGTIHQDPEQREYDAYRNERLRERGLTVLRFTNREVEQSLEAVLGRIVLAAGVRADLTPPFGHPSPSTTDGEGPVAEPVMAPDNAGGNQCRR